MANNYSQPYYGVPFYPQQMQQPAPNAPADAQGGQYSDMHHAPAFSLPGLGAPSPSANQMSFGQNSQQPPYPLGESNETRIHTRVL